MKVPESWVRKTGSAASLFESFFHAFHGIAVGVKEERNVRIHFCLVVVVSLMAVFLQVDAVGWLALILAMGMVITSEFVNTALEHLVDISANNEYHESARYAKDTAAAAVLIASFTAALVGAVVFLPRMLALIPH